MQHTFQMSPLSSSLLQFLRTFGVALLYVIEQASCRMLAVVSEQHRVGQTGLLLCQKQCPSALLGRIFDEDGDRSVCVKVKPAPLNFVRVGFAPPRRHCLSPACTSYRTSLQARQEPTPIVCLIVCLVRWSLACASAGCKGEREWLRSSSKSVGETVFGLDIQRFILRK